jgi:transcriptional regulator with XRE-family HTH domain
MEINASLIKQKRRDKGWTQQQLAEIADVSLRTIQRIEKTGSASNETVSALSTSFEIDREALLIVPRVEQSDLKPLKLGNIYIILVLASFGGCVLGALSTYWLMLP